MKCIIKLDVIKDIYDFVGRAGQEKVIPIATQAMSVVPANSLIGIFSLDLSSPFELEYDDNSTDFTAFLKDNDLIISKND